MARFPGVGDTFGRYQIVRRIGQGGMGTVFEARQLDLGRAVALKVLSADLAEDPDFRARFVREARILAVLDSPHVIQVLDSGEQDGEVYIATQLVQGRDLLQLLREGGPLNAVAATKIVGQVATALADAHEAGVLHRDVKPGNVLVRESRADFFSYLCDFGIARDTAGSHTRTGGVLGTLSYMAPECHEGGDASVRSDIYSLGCVLWAALTGRAPYERTSEYRVALAHMQDEIPTYEGPSPAAGRINEVLRRSMAKNPADRFRTAGEMHAALVEAEEAARGLRRADSGPTGVSLDKDRTQVRVVPAPARGHAPASGNGPGRSRGRRSTTKVIAVWAAALVALVALAGTAVALLGEQGSADPSATPTVAASSAVASPTPRKPAVSKAPRSAAPAQAQSEPTTQASATEPGTGEPGEQGVPLYLVDCWDGSTASAPVDCPSPSGRRGLATVFPSMDDACFPTGTGGVVGKAEVFLCRYGDYVIRYSRWVRGADRHAYLDGANPGADHPPWIVDGEHYGRAWVSYEDSPEEAMKYQWSATYRGNPYSVSVEGIDAEARREGVGQVVATPPGRIGLP